MQRLVYLCTGTSRLFQVVGANHLKNSKLLFEKQNSIIIINNLTFKRSLTTKTKESKNAKNIDTHSDLYKPSTAKEETHVPDDLKGHHQPPETIVTSAKTTGGGKVWSAHDPDGVHIALGRAKEATFIPTSTEKGTTDHETTVYTTQGELNIADPFKTHTLQPEATTAQLAEAAAASAFETFAPDTPSTSSSQQNPVGYETTKEPKVFGGQDTSADTKRHPKENPFDLNKQVKPRQAK